MEPVHNNPPLVPVLSQMDPVHTFPPYFPQIHSNIIFPSSPRFYEWFPPFMYSVQHFYAFLIYPMHAICLAHLISVI
jgi:hypothetical protein